MWRAWLAGVILMLPLACAGAPASVGMVLDLQGAGEMLYQGHRSTLKLLDYLQPGAQLTLAAGTRASLSHYASKQIVRLVGPVQVELEVAGLRHLSGNPMQAASLAEKTVTAALHPNLGPAAFKMRALPQIVVRAPANGGSVLDTRPLFRWDANETASFSIDVMELPERVVARGVATGAQWELPPALALTYGKRYRWTVSYLSATDGKMRSAAATFSLPAQADAEMIAALAPATDAAVDEWVLYATILKDWNLLDAADAAWAKIAARRPDLGHAR
ncbi:MAG: hypothetical protein V4463_02445 [Pseudomonadota bacterium]